MPLGQQPSWKMSEVPGSQAQEVLWQLTQEEADALPVVFSFCATVWRASNQTLSSRL